MLKTVLFPALIINELLIALNYITIMYMMGLKLIINGYPLKIETLMILLLINCRQSIMEASFVRESTMEASFVREEMKNHIL